MQKLRLLIINFNQRVRQGIVSIFITQKGFSVIDEIDSVTDIDYLQRIQPDVILYGLNGWDEKSISNIVNLKEVCPCTILIVFSDFIDKSHILASIAAGVDGYLQTPILPADLVAAIELTCRSGICFFPGLVKEIMADVLPTRSTKSPPNTHSARN